MPCPMHHHFVYLSEFCVILASFHAVRLCLKRFKPRPQSPKVCACGCEEALAVVNRHSFSMLCCSVIS